MQLYETVNSTCSLKLGTGHSQDELILVYFWAFVFLDAFHISFASEKFVLDE